MALRYGSDDRAAWRLAVLFTFVQQMLEHALDALQIRDPSARFLQTLAGNAPDAAAIRAILEFEQCPDFFQAEPQVLRASDEPYAIHVPAAVAAIGARGTSRLRNQSSPFIVTDRLDPDTRSPCETADRVSHVTHSTNPLTPY